LDSTSQRNPPPAAALPVLAWRSLRLLARRFTFDLDEAVEADDAQKPHSLGSPFPPSTLAGRIVTPRGTRFRALPIGSSTALRRGDSVAVLGAPFGGSIVPSVGVLGGIRYVADDEIMNSIFQSRSDWSLLQVDANMTSGNSGGPVVNAAGEVVGVSVMVQAAPLASGAVGQLCYAVAIDQA
jgi:S1-C subfamily serine protease